MIKGKSEVSRTWCFPVGTLIGKSIHSVKCYHHLKHRTHILSDFIRKEKSEKENKKEHLLQSDSQCWFDPFSAQIQTTSFFSLNPISLESKPQIF